VDDFLCPHGNQHIGAGFPVALFLRIGIFLPLTVFVSMRQIIESPQLSHIGVAIDVLPSYIKVHRPPLL